MGPPGGLQSVLVAPSQPAASPAQLLCTSGGQAVGERSFSYDVAQTQCLFCKALLDNKVEQLFIIHFLSTLQSAITTNYCTNTEFSECVLPSQSKYQ